LALPYRWQWRVERWKNALRGLFGGGDEPPHPKLCPSCGTLVGIGATRCHQCGASMRFSLAAISKGLTEFFGGHAPVTTAILIVNILMFGVSWVATAAAGEGGGLSMLWRLGNEALYRLGASNPWAVRINHEWFRLITAMFLHGGLLHIGFNMMVLLDIGPVVEELYGSPRYLFLYVTTGAAGFALSVWHVPAVGASGAIMGLIGLMIAVTTKRSGAAMQALRSRLVSWVVTIFVFGFLMPGIDNWGHFGGLAAGFGLGKLFADREPMNPRERTTAYALGWLAGAVCFASFALMFLHYRDPLPWVR
jgi:rhomboid protease GluP